MATSTAGTATRETPASQAPAPQAPAPVITALHLLAAGGGRNLLAAGGGVHAGWNPWSDVRQMLAYHFMVNALRAGSITAVAAGLIGWFMILRGQSFAGHTLAVVGFPGAAAAIWAGLAATWGYFGACTAAAILIGSTSYRRPGGEAAGESALIGTVQAFALACGLLFVALYKGFLNSLTGLLFGSFLGVTDSQVLALLAMAGIVVAVLGVIGRPLLFASVDPDVARARGVPAPLVSAAFLVLLGVATAEVSQITGSLLVFALLVMPAATARQVTPRPALGLVLSVAVALLVVWVGLGLAFYSVYPVGFYITTTGLVCYLGSAATRRVATRRRTARQTARPAPSGRVS